MPQRLVYNPKVWAFTKDANENIYDISNFITAGSVTRKVNQVSVAELTLRNPDKRFTNATGVAFHPMDPITIWMERAKDRPIQVFTGFLDDTPYLQLFPGTIKLKASCTLKRLLYIYWDPALPYVIKFLNQFGWTLRGDGTIWPGPEPKNTFPEGPNLKRFGANAGEKVPKKKGVTESDASIAKLLYALLFYVAQIKDENIYIESIPGEVAKIVSTLYSNVQQAQKEAKESNEQLEAFLKEVIGTSTQGSGGGETGGEKLGEPKDTKTIVKTMAKIASEAGLPPAFVINTSYNECTFNPNSWEAGIGSSIGWFQFNMRPTGKRSTPYGSSNKSYSIEEAKDIGIATKAFCNAAKAKGIKPESQWEQWATEVQVSVGYPHWNETLPQIKSWISQYAKNEAFGPEPEKEKPEETQTGKEPKEKASSSGGRSRLDEMISQAATISNHNFPYAWGGGHEKVGVPSKHHEHESGGAEVTGFDCSGAVAAVLLAGGYLKKGESVPGSGSFSQYQSSATISGQNPGKSGITVYYNSGHAWMTINGRYFGTGFNGKGGAGWGSSDPATWPSASGTYNSFYYTAKSLAEPHTSEAPPLTGGSSGGETGEGGTTGTGDPLIDAKAAAFTSSLAFPGVMDSEISIMLKGPKALMNDVPLMPFIQQVCQASMRSFMSLPNGNFFAFYPDYFGEMGHNKPYWYIEDIEILDGGVNLSDKYLATHVFAVGDNTFPITGEGAEKFRMLNSAGTVSIFNAFEAGGFLDNSVNKQAEGTAKVKKLAGVGEATAFLKRYGARPVKLDFPMVHSHLFEMLMAYQGFMLAWSRQFITPFTFTFMPELYPGGKVGFPEHGLQMYIEEVTHAFDLETGFTTDAKLSSPSVMEGATAAQKAELPPHMVSALTESLKGVTVAHDEHGQRVDTKTGATGKSGGTKAR